MRDNNLPVNLGLCAEVSVLSRRADDQMRVRKTIKLQGSIDYKNDITEAGDAIKDQRHVNVTASTVSSSPRAKQSMNKDKRRQLRTAHGAASAVVVGNSSRSPDKHYYHYNI